MDVLKRWPTFFSKGISALLLLLVVAVLRDGGKSNQVSTWMRRGLTTTTQRHYDRRALEKAVVVSNNPPKGSLKLCQGDCDHDTDCASGLACFQRNPGEAIPGCVGDPSNRASFCIHSTTSSSGAATTTTTTTTPSTSESEDFMLKLYWQLGMTLESKMLQILQLVRLSLLPPPYVRPHFFL